MADGQPREPSSRLARRLPFRVCIMNGGASRPSLGLGGDLTFVDAQPMLPPSEAHHWLKTMNGSSARGSRSSSPDWEAEGSRTPVLEERTR
jgi:hypothetical protein